MSRSDKAQSLSEILLEAVNKQDMCRLRVLIDALSKEEKIAFDAALRSNLPTTRIAKILNSEGRKINRIFLAEKRKCYLETEECECRTKTK